MWNCLWVATVLLARNWLGDQWWMEHVAICTFIDASQKKIALAFRLQCGTVLYNLTEVAGLHFFKIPFIFSELCGRLHVSFIYWRTKQGGCCDFCIRKCPVMRLQFGLCSHVPPHHPLPQKNGCGSSHENKRNEVVGGYTTTWKYF